MVYDTQIMIDAAMIFYDGPYPPFFIQFHSFFWIKLCKSPPATVGGWRLPRAFRVYFALPTVTRPEAVGRPSAGGYRGSPNWEAT